MVDEPAAKIFLQNKLARCRTKSQEIEPILEEKREDYFYTGRSCSSLGVQAGKWTNS